MAWGRFGSARDYDQPFDEWADDRSDAVDQRQAYEDVGYDAWANSTRSGENLQAAQPSDVVALGRSVLGADASTGADGGPPSNAQVGADEGLAPAAPRYVKARPGDSISSLLGTSSPGAIGRFAALNGMDGSRSTLFAGKVYALPADGDEPSADDVAAGSRILGLDNARAAALRAPNAANDPFTARLLAGQNVWTGEPAANPTYRSVPNQVPQAKPWWDQTPAKAVGGTAAYGVGALFGVPFAAYHAARDILDEAPFELGLVGALGPEAQAKAVGGTIDAGRNAAGYARAAANDPSRVISDIGDAAHQAIDRMSPLNAPMSSGLGDVLNHQFRAGLSAGEMATNIAGLFAGGETLQGLRAAQMFDMTRAANIEKFVAQGANPKLAEYLAQPYEGMGHHSIAARRAKIPSKVFGVPVDERLAGQPLPSWLSDSPLNVSVPRGMSRGDFYEYHYQVDPKAYGFRLPKDLNGGKGWSGKQLGLTRYNVPQRVWYGMPVPLKDGLAAVPLLDEPALYNKLEGPQ